MMKTMEQLAIEQRTVFIRVDFNVSVKDGQVQDDSRIRASLPTLQYALDQQAKLILASHLGRPQGKRNPKYSLLPVAEHLSRLLNKEVIIPEDCIGDAVRKLVHELRYGEVILLENLRFHPEEETNDPIFSEKLASLAQVYVNDAFGTAHRVHASTVGMVSHFENKGIGFLLKKEIETLTDLTTHPQKPYLAIFGGAKISGKIELIENVLNYADGILIGGGMAYTFLKAKGVDVGRSLVEEGKVHLADKILSRARTKGVDIGLPLDSMIAPKLKEGVPTRSASNGENWNSWMGLDIGPKTIEAFIKKINEAKTIFWNGPMGVFEMEAFRRGTFEVARAVASSPAKSVVGGGDSLAALHAAGLSNDDFYHLSTGGGASMEFLEGKTLPGLRALGAVPK